MSLTLPPLPYANDALEPYISRRTLAVHHGNHHAAYVAKTRALIQRTPLESASLEEIVRSSASQDKALFNAAAQAWNHGFYWQSMRPGGGGEATGAIAGLIEASFGSQKAFSQQFVTAAGDQFGSGWAWLVLDEGRLRIVATSNAETPLTYDASTPVDDRCVGARLLPRLSTSTPGLHRGVPGPSHQLGFRQSESGAPTD